MLYSGGVDSTFALKRYVDEGNEPPDLLMIHGMTIEGQTMNDFNG